MVRQWQELFYDRRYSQTKLSEINFVKLADAFGAHGIRRRLAERSSTAIEEALAVPKARYHRLQNRTRGMRVPYGSTRSGHSTK